MKIDTDLRQAVRSACNAQPDDGWFKRGERIKAAIKECIELPKHRAKSAKMLEIRARAIADLERADKFFNSLGIYGNLSALDDEKKFRASGGVIPKQTIKWKFDAVMAELAAAKTSERKKILSKYGIQWD